MTYSNLQAKTDDDLNLHAAKEPVGLLSFSFQQAHHCYVLLNGTKYHEAVWTPVAKGSLAGHAGAGSGEGGLHPDDGMPQWSELQYT